ncbi:MAG: VanZ family protein [Mariprofundaceae bacterium]|nr:VanZ family protein [Mariprofundaceae bacterium]
MINNISIRHLLLSKTTSQTKAWCLLGAWGLFIFLLSNQQHPQLNFDAVLGWQNILSQLNDKYVHATFWAILAMAIWHAITPQNAPLKFKYILISLLIASTLGALDEFHQYFIPSRSCDILDWFADSVGAALTLATLYLYHYIKHTKVL